MRTKRSQSTTQIPLYYPDKYKPQSQDFLRRIEIMATFEKNHNSANSGNGVLINLILFALISPIVVIFVLPSVSSFFNPPHHSKGSEAKQYTGSMNRAQQAKYAENGSFPNSVDALGIGIKTETTNYKYSVEATKNAAFNYGVSKVESLRGYVGGVFAVPSTEPNAAKDEMQTSAILCAAKTPDIIKPAHPYLVKGSPVCGYGTEEVKK
jgi:type IV pilus assembly protein PilA